MLDFNKIELSILNKTEIEIKNVLEKYEIQNLHIDIMDGYFVKNLSSITPFLLKNLNLENYNLNLHFMVEDVETYFSYYDFLENIKYVSFHFESDFYKKGEIIDFIDKLKQKNIKVGLAINPDTKINSLLIEDFSPLKIFDYIQLMTVEPGLGGQKFIPKMEDKILNIKNKFHKKIIIDGGVNNEIYEKYKNIVDKFVIGNYLYK